MGEYDFLNKMLSDKYLRSNQSVLIEEGVQATRISQGRCVPYMLYRFDTKGKDDILPFFNQTNNSPKNLKAFCDYIILAEYDKKPYAILIELKSGDAEHAQCQLNASQCFVDYLKLSAVRIKDANDCITFNGEAVNTVKVVVKPVKTRRTTRIDNPSNLKGNGGYLTYTTTTFDISRVCRFAGKL